jgi:FkbM family methyltransferase
MRFNEFFTMKAGLGLQQLQRYPTKSSSLELNICLPVITDLSLADYSQSSAYFKGLPPLCVTLMEHASEDALFLDIGANIGLVSAAMGKVLKPRAIHSFEPNPSTFLTLQKNLLMNCPGAFAHCIAISDCEALLQMSVIENDAGSCSVQKTRFEENRQVHGQRISPTTVQIPAIPLDKWVAKNIDYEWKVADLILLKIDVEGHELEVLSGMHSLLKNKCKKVLCVIESENSNIPFVKEIFESWGFQIHRPSWNPNLQEFPHHTDLVFRRL